MKEKNKRFVLEYLFFLQEKQDISNQNQEKEIELRTVETPGDERDTQLDAQSISVTTDLPIESETDYDSQKESFDNEK